jgi:hypothetical protein
MTTKILQWQRIAMLATGIATSMVSMAWGQELYQTHSDGTIWQYTGTPCKGGSCPGWIELDNNSDLSMIAAGGGALYEMHKDGSIWWYIGPACSGGSCPGWVELDNNSHAVAIGVGGSTPYEMHTDGSLWEYNGVICTGGFCPGWTELSPPQPAPEIPFGFLVGADASLVVYGNLDLYGENLYMYGGALNNWPQIDTTIGAYALSFAVGANTLYEMKQSPTDYAIRQYTGSPITYNWETIFYGKGGTFSSIAAGGGLYQQRQDANDRYESLWQYTGTPCNGTTCPGWVKIDDNAGLGPIAGSNTVYQMKASAAGGISIWQYTGTPCSGSVCSGWVKLDDNPDTTSIVAGPATFGYSITDGPVNFGGRSTAPPR